VLTHKQLREILLPGAFIKWAQAQSQAGHTRDAVDCPVARYVKDATGQQVYVNTLGIQWETPAGVETYWLPLDFRTFVVTLDTLWERPPLAVTGQQAANIMRAVCAA
jgi:hypothetical protein